ncbi:MAG: peptidoglycan O-acetyltransferase [Leptospiraceae bacterium]|nr:MAG: peptidoglycan O-acetyltransferase [Leptospiraceae bacterium]
MLFNSFEFIFLFVPIVFFIYFLLAKFNRKASRIWLVICSLFFYSYWKLEYLPLIVISIIINFTIGYFISQEKNKKILLMSGILFNLFLLGYYKYYDFIIENLNLFLEKKLPLLHLVLPLGISFFTFQQIAYLVDSYKGETKEYDFFDYALFVSFFPQLIAGPIVHHKEMMPQFESKENLKINYKNIAIGLFLFSIGLYKKVILADNLGIIADTGFNNPENIALFDAWLASLAFTFQIYFDFSGYSDMAVGLGRLFNIHIVWNFDSPFKTNNIQDLWRKWHITLSRFLRDYIYIPLGGSRVSKLRSYFNLFITFVIGGIWHGAGWTYIIWGALTGIGIILHKLWKDAGYNIRNNFFAITINFIYFHLGSVFFRSDSLKTAFEFLKGMFGFNQIILPESFKFLNLDNSIEYLNLGSKILNTIHADYGLYFLFAFIIAFLGKNSRELTEYFKPNIFYFIFTVFLFVTSVVNLLKISKFLYFNF